MKTRLQFHTWPNECHLLIAAIIKIRRYNKAKDKKDATAYHRERYGKREFKGKSPLATSKGSTLVAREGLLSQLQNAFGKNLKDKSILNEDAILDE